MTRALIVVGALLAVAFGVLAVVVFATRDEDRVAVDNLLALELTRTIGVSEGGEVDLRRLAGFRWDRVLVVAPGTPREAVSDALGSEYRGELPFGSTGQVFVFADGPSSRASPTTAGAPRSAASRGRSTCSRAGVRCFGCATLGGQRERTTGSGGARGAAPWSARAPSPSTRACRCGP